MGGRLLLVLLVHCDVDPCPVVEVLTIVGRAGVGLLLLVHLRGEDSQESEHGPLVDVEAVLGVLDEVGVVGYLHAVAVVLNV